MLDTAILEVPVELQSEQPAGNPTRWQLAIASSRGEADTILESARQMGCRETEVIEVREDNFQVRWR